MPDDSNPLPQSPLGDAQWSRSTVLLFERQIAFLDHLSQDIETRTGHRVTQAEIVRSLVDAVIWSGVDETIIAAMYGSERETVAADAEVTSPDAAPRSSAELLRDVLVDLLRE
ncbi:MAG: hypothetical protein ABIJ09_16235 [Pseudomonadota bacterium]